MFGGAQCSEALLMAQFPAFPLWTDAYLADTGHLTTIEHGAYLLLLVTMWRNGGELPNDDKELARYARMTSGQWLRIRPRLMRFFTVSSDSITQGRLTDELVAVKQKSAKQSDSARAKWRKNRDKRHASADAEMPVRDIPDASQNDASQTLNLKEEDKSSSILSETSSDAVSMKAETRKYPDDFEAFWQPYPRSPNMSKAKAAAGWKRLSSSERKACVEAVGPYKAFLASKADHPTMHAATFINEKRFEGFRAEPPKPADDSVWVKRLDHGRSKSQWFPQWGPMPGHPDSRVPRHLIKPTDGATWREMEKRS
jgi:uncharacterized protein YdaU (DUF1376 family)